MTERQASRPDPGDAGGVAQDRPPVPPQGTRQPAAGRPPGDGPEAGRMDTSRADTEHADTETTGTGRGGMHAAEREPADAGSDTGRTGRREYAPAAGMGGVTAAIAGLAWGAVLACALGVIAVGIMLLVWPSATLTVVAILIGAGLLVAGVMRLVDGIAARSESGGMRAADIIIGLLAIVAGLYCLKHHSLTVVVLALVVGAYWVIHGVGDLVGAASAGPVPGRGLRVVAGLFSIAAGVIVLFWPGISLILLLTILGAWLLFYGVVLAGLALWMRRDSRQDRAPRTARTPRAAPA
jgi:uncharacterized membrane protein HdeD (DUF308 family)